ncbi:MAG: hypothetical protein ABW276_11175 [Casimicrobiaceae bacterium]
MQRIRAMAVMPIALLAFAAGAQTHRIADATGRSVAVPASVERVYAAGPPASVILLALAPQKLIGWTRAPHPDERPFLPDSVVALPELGRTLAQEAPVLILDEPTASLDFGNRARVLAELDRLRGSGLAIVFSTHEPDHALAHADRALLLADGRPLALDTVDRALSAENVGRLYRVPVRRVEMGGQRRIVVDG